MPDISMCLNKSCPSSKRCYRAQAEPSSRQAWASFKVLDGNMRCDKFEELKDDEGGRTRTDNKE